MFAGLLITHWSELEKARLSVEDLSISGRHQSIGRVVAVSRYPELKVSLDPAACSKIPAGAEVVASSLARGLVIYGVNTGFGGNADTRVGSSGVEELQRCLIRGKHCGILATSPSSAVRPQNGNGTVQGARPLIRSAIPLDFPESTTCMPESWVRAAMFIRLNSLISGASGVQLTTVETLAELLNHDLVPLMPLRGSISASGDLSPLSYIAGVMQGKPTLSVFAGPRDNRHRARADRALAEAKIAPVVLGPKEGLAIINGTAVSAGVAALALHESLCLAGLSQILTAMSVEAFLGTDESFHPFIAEVRPHPGQVDSARAIFAFLSGSRLSQHNDGRQHGLRQDRYSIRTASQWIGPVLEDLALAHEQLRTEVNSVTDNPLVDGRTGSVYHGGNFQAKAVTSAVEKLRPALQALGRMLFSQSAELFNPATNRGLPPNLVADEPSRSYLWKGLDIHVAAMASELGFLANPVGSHVMTAELGNQGINSLALISARYTMTAVECLSQLAAAHLLVLCQALDLRALHASFVELFGSQGRLFEQILDDCLADFLPHDEGKRARLKAECLGLFLGTIDRDRTLDSEPLLDLAVESTIPMLLRSLPPREGLTTAIQLFVRECVARARGCLDGQRALYRRNPDATPYLGKASRRMYVYVRKTLGVPFLSEEQVTTPAPELVTNKGEADDDDNAHVFPGTVLPGMPPTVGSYLTVVYQAIRSGELYEQVVECFKAVDGTDSLVNGKSHLNGQSKSSSGA